KNDPLCQLVLASYKMSVPSSGTPSSGNAIFKNSYFSDGRLQSLSTFDLEDDEKLLHRQDFFYNADLEINLIEMISDTDFDGIMDKGIHIDKVYNADGKLEQSTKTKFDIPNGGISFTNKTVSNYSYPLDKMSAYHYEYQDGSDTSHAYQREIAHYNDQDLEVYNFTYQVEDTNPHPSIATWTHLSAFTKDSTYTENGKPLTRITKYYDCTGHICYSSADNSRPPHSLPVTQITTQSWNYDAEGRVTNLFYGVDADPSAHNGHSNTAGGDQEQTCEITYYPSSEKVVAPLLYGMEYLGIDTTDKIKSLKCKDQSGASIIEIDFHDWRYLWEVIPGAEEPS
ncbi:MAG: hypothetical protein R3257_05995, partial [bacterium]|nr:hypothetical protein [bacterium]